MHCKTSIILLTGILSALLYGNRLQAQSPGLPQTSFSHFYLVIDSVAYHTLKNDPFCKDSLFKAAQSSSTMDQGSWSGNYLLGKKDYWEVMQSSSLEHAATGDIGLGHMLHKPQLATELQRQWQALTPDLIELHPFTMKNGADTVIVELMNYRDSMLLGGKACFFVMYYHPSILKRSGFTEEYINTVGVDEATLQLAWYGGDTYDRLYNKIEKIYLQLTPHEYSRHRLALQAMGYTETGKQAFKKEIEVVIELVDNPHSRVKKVEFSLLKNVTNRKIVLSPDVFISLKGSKGELVIN